MKRPHMRCLIYCRLSGTAATIDDQFRCCHQLIQDRVSIESTRAQTAELARAVCMPRAMPPYVAGGGHRSSSRNWTRRSVY